MGDGGTYKTAWGPNATPTVMTKKKLLKSVVAAVGVEVRTKLGLEVKGGREMSFEIGNPERQAFSGQKFSLLRMKLK